MSKKKTTVASSVKPGDVIRLVYEVKVNKVDDLDTVIAAEVPDILVISGLVRKGPLRNNAVTFAIAADDAISVVSRQSRPDAICDRVRQGFHTLVERFKALVGKG